MSAPLRPLGVAELLDTAVRAAYRNAPAVLAVSVPFAVARAGTDAALRYAAVTSSVDRTTVLILGEIAVSCLLGTVLAGLLAPLFTAELLDRRIGASESVRRARRSAGALVVLALLVTIAQTVGVVLLGVGGVWLWGVWAVAAPALVLERLGPRAALRRSVTLVRTQFWRTWGIRALRWVVTIVLGLVITLPFSALAAYLTDSNLFRPYGVSDAGLFVTLTALGHLIALAVLSPVSAAVDTLLYLDLRMRREGMDLVLALPQPRAGVTA